MPRAPNASVWKNLLTRLTGVTRPILAGILADKPTGLDRLPVPGHPSIAIPSRALMQRPDIRAAERRLAAASADIGPAEADRYPRLTLNGELGYTVNGTPGAGSLSFGTWSSTIVEFADLRRRTPRGQRSAGAVEIR